MKIEIRTVVNEILPSGKNPAQKNQYSYTASAQMD
jgi:hypothetical protein